MNIAGIAIAITQKNAVVIVFFFNFASKGIKIIGVALSFHRRKAGGGETTIDLFVSTCRFHGSFVLCALVCLTRTPQ